MSAETKKHVVDKPFTTPHRRFAKDAPVTEADITGPVSFADWKERGFIRALPDEETRAIEGADAGAE